MKNMIKMSLVAAVAVAGLSSNVAAKPLEEAIKDVDVSGSVLYRYHIVNNDNTATSGDSKTNYYKIASTVKSKINDTVTASVRIVAGSSRAGIQGLNDSTTADTSLNFTATQANFTVKTDAATIIAGKQGLATPWTVALDNDGSEQYGTGLVALIPAGPVTVAAAAFNQTNLDDKVGNGTETVSTIGVMGKAGPVSFDAWYLDVQDTLDTYTLSAKTKVDVVTLSARYTSLELDSATTDNSLFDLKATAKIGKVGVWAQYAMTDKDGGLTALENSAKTTIEGWQVTTNSKADADYFGLGANMDVMSGLNVALNYRQIDFDTNSEDSELYTQITHKMGKNLVTYVRLGQIEKEANGVKSTDSLTSRLQVEYKF